MRWADGSLFGESLTGYQSEFLPALPEAVARDFELFETELKLADALQAAEGKEAERIRAELEQFRRSAGIPAGGTAQPAPASEEAALEAPQVSLDDLAYTQENPLTDLNEIRTILNALQDRHDTKLSQPGWYLYGHAQSGGLDFQPLCPDPYARSGKWV